MAKTTYVQTNFTSGELTPKLRGRGDASNYQNGAEIIENAVVSVHGGLDRRDGLAFVRSTKHGAASRARLIPYVFNESQAFLIELGVGYARFYTAQGALLVDGSMNPIEVSTPYSEAHLPAIQYTQGADTMLLFHPDIRPQRLQRLTNNQWRFGPAPFVVEPFGELGHRPDARLYLGGTTGSQTFSTVDVDYPDPPTGVSAQALNTAARVHFTPPGNTGGKPIIRYVVTASPGGATAVGTQSPLVVTGLTNGVSYTFTVRAETSFGPSAESSASNSVTPNSGAASPTLTVNLSPPNIDIGVQNGQDIVNTPTASAPGASPPVTFTWSILSASGGISMAQSNGPIGALFSNGFNNNNYATLRCTAVDASGASGSRDCNITVRHKGSGQLL